MGTAPARLDVAGQLLMRPEIDLGVPIERRQQVAARQRERLAPEEDAAVMLRGLDAGDDRESPTPNPSPVRGGEARSLPRRVRGLPFSASASVTSRPSYSPPMALSPSRPTSTSAWSEAYSP